MASGYICKADLELSLLDGGFVRIAFIRALYDLSSPQVGLGRMVCFGER